MTKTKMTKTTLELDDWEMDLVRAFKYARKQARKSKARKGLRVMIVSIEIDGKIETSSIQQLIPTEGWSYSDFVK